MDNLILSEINIYPVKSLGGISLSSSMTLKRGLQFDRRWLIVDKNNVFITQREYPLMALIATSLNIDGIVLTDKRNPSNYFTLPFEVNEGNAFDVVIWNDTVKAVHWNADADKWISDFLGDDFRFVYMPEYSERKVNPKFRINDEIVSFADGYPFMVIGQESLNELNRRLEIPLPMNRFRPSFVFTGGNAFAEDHWKIIKIGNAEFRGTKLCERCPITTTNQETAERGKEPLKTLATFRAVQQRILFGQNFVSVKEGQVKLGDKIIVQETADFWPADE